VKFFFFLGLRFENPSIYSVLFNHNSNHTTHNIMKNKLETLRAINEFREDFKCIQVRREYINRGDAELRTKKSDHLAQVFDELLNVFILTKDLRRVQLLKSECNWF